MKSIVIKSFVLLALCQLTISCNSCEDKNTDPVPTGTPEVSNNSTQADVTDQATDNGNSAEAANGSVNNSGNGSITTSNKNNAGASAGSPSTMSTSVNKSRDISTAKNSKNRQSKSGYSAPNGTDAENHDGDPYTKHDTTPMPTGTSIR